MRNTIKATFYEFDPFSSDKKTMPVVSMFNVNVDEIKLKAKELVKGWLNSGESKYTMVTKFTTNKGYNCYRVYNPAVDFEIIVKLID